jgi:hypothetical protein
MIKKDYLMRKFEDFGKALAILFQMKRDQEWEKFDKEISEIAKKFTSLELKNVELLDDMDFANDILQREGFEQENKMMLAALLFEKMTYYLETDEQNNYLNLKNKCLKLYEHIRDNFTENEFNLDVYYKIEFLKKIND